MSQLSYASVDNIVRNIRGQCFKDSNENGNSSDWFSVEQRFFRVYLVPFVKLFLNDYM